MATGFQVVGNSGAWQADDTFASMALRAKGRATFPADRVAPYNLSTNIWIDVGVSESPIFAVRADYPICVFGAVRNGNSWSYGVITPHNQVDGFNGGKSFDWLLFDRPQDLGSRSGLCVWDSQGRLTFDAMHKYARVRGLQSVPTSGSTRTVDYGSATMAYAFTRIPIVATVTMLVPGANYTHSVAFGGVAAQGTSLVGRGFSAHQLTNVIAPPAPYPDIQVGEILALDVTNY